VYRHFTPRTHQNAQCDAQILLDAKTPVRLNVSRALVMETTPVPPEHEK
jgi:hypothetical protein